MNLAIRGIEANFGPKNEDTFRDDLHKDLKADFIIANPPFNDSDWSLDPQDVRWKYGVPSKSNANFGWVQHFIHHLAPGGFAGFVLANGAMSSGQNGEAEIRQAIVEADLVDCMVALPSQLFYSTQIPVCLWFLARNKADGKRRNRKGETLFIDARKMGTMVDRVHREMTDADIAKIVGSYHAWRGDKGAAKYEDVAGFSKGANLEEIKKNGHVLTPGRYVGAENVEDNGEPYESKMTRLVAELNAQFDEANRLQKKIEANLKGLGYEK
jgi:type I restriction enzyme M protein